MQTNYTIAHQNNGLKSHALLQLRLDSIFLCARPLLVCLYLATYHVGARPCSRYHFLQNLQASLLDASPIPPLVYLRCLSQL